MPGRGGWNFDRSRGDVTHVFGAVSRERKSDINGFASRSHGIIVGTRTNSTHEEENNWCKVDEERRRGK